MHLACLFILAILLQRKRLIAHERATCNYGIRDIIASREWRHDRSFVLTYKIFVWGAKQSQDDIVMCVCLNHKMIPAIRISNGRLKGRVLQHVCVFELGKSQDDVTMSVCLNHERWQLSLQSAKAAANTRHRQ